MSMAGRRRRPGRPSRRRASTGLRARASPPCRCSGRDLRPSASATPTWRRRAGRTPHQPRTAPHTSRSSRWRRSRPPRPTSGAPAPSRPTRSCATRAVAVDASSARVRGPYLPAGCAARASAAPKRASTTRRACAAWRRCSTTAGAARRRRASRARAGRGWRAWARWRCRCRACGCTGRCAGARRRARRCTRAAAAPAAAAPSLRRGSPVLSSPAAPPAPSEAPSRAARVATALYKYLLASGELRTARGWTQWSLCLVRVPSGVWWRGADIGRAPRAHWVNLLRVPCKYSRIVWMYVNVSLNVESLKFSWDRNVS